LTQGLRQQLSRWYRWQVAIYPDNGDLARVETWQ
jgi:hypothetical protein